MSKRSAKKVQHQFNINTELSVITKESNLTIAISLVKFFLQFLNLLPFQYENFKYFSEMFKQNKLEKKLQNNDWNQELIEKERTTIIEISNSITNLFKV